MIHKLKILFIFLAIITLVVPSYVLAEAPFDPKLTKSIAGMVGDIIANNFNSATNENSLFEIVGQLISVFLGLLGTLFICLMVYAGYVWMTASGNEVKVKKAQEVIAMAIIGLIIILGAYIVTYFVFLAVPDGVPVAKY